MMKPYFRWSYAGLDEPLLVSTLEVKSPLAYLITNVFVVLAAACFEWGLYLRQNTACTNWSTRAYATVLYVNTMAVAYILMLVVMTYDLGLLLSVLAGLGLGHLIFNTPPPAHSRGKR